MVSRAGRTVTQLGSFPSVLRYVSGDGHTRYVRYCRSAMAQKLSLTRPGIFRRAERKETIYGLDRTSYNAIVYSNLKWF